MPRPKGVSIDDPSVVVSYRPQGATIAEFHRRTDPVRNLIGPLGSAKTTGCIIELLRRIHDMPPCKDGVRRSRWIAVRNTYPDLITTTIHDFMLIGDAIGRITMGSPPTWRCKYRRKDGSVVEGQVIFRAFDGADDQKKARSLNLTGAWLNEAAELAKANVDIIQSRVGRFPPRSQCPDGRFDMITDSNMPDRDHWLSELAFTIKPEGWWFGIQPAGVIKVGGKWMPNPHAENVQNLPDGYYERLIPGKKDNWIRKNLGNESVFVSDGLPIHPDFSESLHVREVEPAPRKKLYVGIDFGRTPAATIFQRQDNGQIYVLKELVTFNMGAKRFGELLKVLLNDEYSNFDVEFTGDPAGSDMAQTDDETPFDMLAISGIDAYPAYTNEPEIRFEALDSLLTKTIGGEPAIMIDPSCVTLIKGLAGAYQFRRLQVVGRETFTNKPDKGKESHVCESLHYGLLGAGEGDALFTQDWGKEMEDMPTIPDSVFE